jgi:hypothetical protein
MFKFGLKNLRRLEVVSPIEIKPITILVGRNSSGKSSFLRALPLLRQSIMTRTSSPILWYGDLVDFGSFEGAISNNDSNRMMSFAFEIDEISFGKRGYYVGPGNVMSRRSGAFKGVKFEVFISNSKESSTISSISITADGGLAQFSLSLDSSGSVESLLIDEEDVLRHYQSSHFIIQQGSIFPDLLLVNDEKSGQDALFYQREEPVFARAVAELLSPHLDKRIKRPALMSLTDELLSLPSFEKEHLAQFAEGVSGRSFKKLLANISTKDTNALYKRLLRFHHANNFVPLFRTVTERLRRVISETLYIGPARARSERYYRYQDLAVSEIDPDGKNFAMFLNSMNELQLGSLSEWVYDLFGYRISLTRSAGHISINLVEGESETNIVDTGYGVSQILPVLGQIWWAANKDRGTSVRPYLVGNEVSMLAIEQPELHLHPAHQALLADALADSPSLSGVKGARKSRTHFIVETHSESLVNRLGELISLGRLSPDDVQIILFEPDPEACRHTEVRIARFGLSGELIDWPYGFFQPN